MRLAFCFLPLLFILNTVVGQDRLTSNGQIPILAWYGIPPQETTPARYLEMSEAGITLQLTTFPDVESMEEALNVAAKVGVKLLVSCPELRKDTEKTVRRLMNHPGVAGYHLMDEPALAEFTGLAEWARKITAIDGKHYCYVNLFPNIATQAQLGTTSYRDYIKESIRQIPLKFVSFDFYPVFKDHLAKTWYENLEQISQESAKAGLPFWAFALTTNYDEDHLTPQTLAAIRLQVYSDLAYGAQAIQYFTYWSATSIHAASREDQRGAPISAAGKRSVVYDRIKLMSAEIKSLSPVFLGSRVKWVRHAGKGMIPDGTIRLTSLPEPVKVLDAGGAPILVSLLENGNNSFLVIVNKDFQQSINLTVYGDESMKKVLKDGTLVPARAYDPTLELDPGDAAIFTFPTPAAQK